MLACTGCLSEPPRAECRPPRAVVEVNTPGDETGPWISPDRLEMLFTSGDRNGRNTILKHASRASPEDDFDDIVEASGLMTPGAGARDGFIEADGRTLWFTGFDLSGPPERLFRATRDADRSALFRDVKPVQGIDVGGHPSLTADGLTLFFHREAGGTQAVHRATRESRDQDFSDERPLQQLGPSDALGVTAPSVSGDGARLLFTVAETSNRLQIYEADRNGAEFEPGSAETDVLAGASNDRDAVLHTAGESIVFASDRDGNFDLFVACE